VRAAVAEDEVVTPQDSRDDGKVNDPEFGVTTIMISGHKSASRRIFPKTRRTLKYHQDEQAKGIRSCSAG